MGGMGGMGGGYDDYGGGGYGDGGGGGSSLEVIESSDDLNDFFADNKQSPIAVGYFIQDGNELEKSFFEEASKQWGNAVKAVLITNAEHIEAKKIKGNTIYLYPAATYTNTKYGDKPRARFPSSTISSADAIVNFVKAKALPLVSVYDFNTEDLFLKKKIPQLTIFTNVDHEKDPKGYTYVSNRALKVASEHKGKLQVAIADKTTQHTFLTKHKADFVDGKFAVGIKDGIMYYAMEEAFGVDAIKAFVKKFQNAELTGNEVSDDAPAASHGSENEEEDDGSPDYVVHSGASSFKSDVEDFEGDVLLEFYAPWCGHCKALKPEYKAAANAFKDDANIRLVAFDATASDPPVGYNVEGYPTVMWMPADKKVAVPYEGPRQADGIVQFIKTNRASKPSA